VNKALSDTKAELYESLHVKTSESSSPKKIDQREQQSLYKRFFSTIKDKLSEGGVGRVFITGVSPIALNDFTSGFNITTHITHHEEFEGICGIYDSEINIALDKMIPKDLQLKKELLKTMKDNYNGYMFTPTQSTPIFNTTLVVYFLREFQRLKKKPLDLIDSNVQPSESGLEIISKSPLAQQVIDELYENEEQGVYVQERVSRTISTRDMMNLLQTNSMYILSFLYYLGALTQTFLPKGKETGTVFKIPNQVIKTQFIDIIKERLSIDETISRELNKSVNLLVEKRDIGPLCQVIQTKVLSQLTGNDVDHALEDGLKLSFLLALNISGRSIRTMNEFREKKEDQYTKWGDLVIEKENIHVEYKNVKVEEVILSDGRFYDRYPEKSMPRSTWDEGVAIAKEIENLSDDELFKLKLRPSKGEKKRNHLGQTMETIGDVWESALKQTRENQAWISQKIGTRVDSFCVLRIGLYRLKYAKV
jgi:hypothetical protein